MTGIIYDFAKNHGIDISNFIMMYASVRFKYPEEAAMVKIGLGEYFE